MSPAPGREDGPREFRLNEEMISGISRRPDGTACAPERVLAGLFRQIAPRAAILPTENYYYFEFYHGGKAYLASVRLGVDSRDKGILQFNCHEVMTDWIKDSAAGGVELELAEKDGVDVTRIAPLRYKVTYRGLSVEFLLNDLDQRPNLQLLGEDEEFAGRIFDESGVRFDLVFNRQLKLFYFVLDKTVVATESFVRSGPLVYVGKRTGFVFYSDAIQDRLILVAVYSHELNNNSPYDGPFDQLPENFYKQLGFWERVYSANPELRGRVTEGGTYKDSGLIYAILPYRSYLWKEDLDFVYSCVERQRQRAQLIRCLVD